MYYTTYGTEVAENIKPFLDCLPPFPLLVISDICRFFLKKKTQEEKVSSDNTRMSFVSHIFYILNTFFHLASHLYASNQPIFLYTGWSAGREVGSSLYSLPSHLWPGGYLFHPPPPLSVTSPLAPPC